MRVTLTENQARAVETTVHEPCVDAGAGSGKTGVLIGHIIHLIENEGAELDQIVAITFTDKAADEMRDRLRKEFREKAWLGDSETMNRWRKMERLVETARISTIHSFCSSLLRENALHIGMDPDFTVLAEAEAAILSNEVVTDTVHKLLEEGDEPTMRLATEYGTNAVVGTLETMLEKRLLIERAGSKDLLEDPEQLLGSWQKSVENQVLSSLPKMRTQLAAFDGKCSKDTDGREVLRQQMMGLLARALDSQDLTATLALLQEIGGLKVGRGPRTANWDPPEAFEELKALQGSILKSVTDLAGANGTLDGKAARLTCDFYAVYSKVLAAYQDAKHALTAVDFDDQISMALATLRENERVRARTAKGMKYLLIDEFQDTDGMQLELAKLLAAQPGGPQFFFVGDAKQSIYYFRGAEVEVFQAEREQAQEVIPLRKNFRTVPEVLEFVNDFFERSGLLHLVEKTFHRLEVGREAAGECRVEFLIPEEREKPASHGKIPIDDYRGDEADLIAWRIGEMCRGKNPAQVFNKEKRQLRPADFGDVALIFRSMTRVSIYERSLRLQGIPYNVVAGHGYYDRQEIMDIHNLLTVLIDPWDEMALLGFLRGPLGCLSDEALVRLCADQTLVQAFSSGAAPADPEEKERLNAARELIADLRAHSEMPLSAFLRYVLDRTGYEAIALDQFLGVQKASNVRKIIDLADDCARTRPPNLETFVHYLDDLAAHGIREGDAPMQPEGSGSVTLMTIHKAKGLEFPIVVVPDVARQRDQGSSGSVVMHRTLGMAARVTDEFGVSAKPAMYSAICDAQKEQEDGERARVLYVAMTRARDWLLIGGAPLTRKSSWMGAFDEQYSVLGRGDGEAFSGESGWTATMRRKCGAATMRREPKARARPLPELECLERRASRVATTRPGRKTFSVTELLALMAGDEHGDDRAGAPARDAVDALLRGTIVHRMFELWDFQSEPPTAAVLRQEFASVAAWDALADDLHDIAEKLMASPLGQRLASEQNVRREAPFLLRVGDALVSGTIDCLLEDATIIDYKTGQHKPEAHSQYEWQLRLYAAAVQRLLGKPPPAAILYYADIGAQYDVDLSQTHVDEALDKAKQAIRALRERPIEASEIERGEMLP